MGRDAPYFPADGEWYMTGPFKLAYAGLGLSVSALIFTAVFSGEFSTFLSVLQMLAGILCAAGAVWAQLAHLGEDDFEERSKAGVLVALASGSVLFSYLVLRQHGWDSLEDFMLVLWCVTLGAVPVLMLPRFGRRAIVSGLVLFHFGGILTATTAVPVPGSPAPWFPTLMWNNVYRKYLTFTYLNNAYHFYSPEPGPPSLVWFLVEFEDGSKAPDDPTRTPPEWLRLVRKDEVATRQQYQRYLSLTESVNQYGYSSPFRTEELRKKRAGAGEIRQIPMNPYLSVDQQFREPAALAKEYLESYAMFVCRTTKSSKNPEAKVKSVKIYRLTHQLITPAELTGGLSPTDPTKYWAFFFGEYAYHPEATDPKKVVELKRNAFGRRDEPFREWKEPAENGGWREEKEPARDPFLYWMLPIYRVPKDPNVLSKDPKDYILIDALSRHAGVTIEWELDGTTDDSPERSGK